MVASTTITEVALTKLVRLRILQANATLSSFLEVEDCFTDRVSFSIVTE